MYKKIQTHTLQALIAKLDSDPATTRRARERAEWLLHFAEHGHSVQVTCRHFSLSPVTFYRLLRRFDPADPETLGDKSRRPHTIRGATSPETVALVRQAHGQYPQLSRDKLSLLLSVEHGVRVSVSTIARILRSPGLRESGILRPGSGLVVKSDSEKRQDQFIAVNHGQDAGNKHHCFLCAIHAHWPALKRTAFVASMLGNLALVGFILLTAFLESESVKTRTLPASLIPPAINTTPYVRTDAPLP